MGSDPTGIMYDMCACRPTIRYFNKATGYDGAFYKPRTELELFDELGSQEYMDEYVEEVANLPTCRVDTRKDCNPDEIHYIEENINEDLEELWFLLSKLEGPHNSLIRLDPRKRKWHKQRFNIMKQLIVAAQAKDRAMYPRQGSSKTGGSGGQQQTQKELWYRERRGAQKMIVVGPGRREIPRIKGG